MSRKIEDIDAKKIALVDAAANRRKFFLIKRSKAMDKLIKLLKNLLGEEVVTDEAIELLKSHSEETITELEKALEVLGGYDGDFPGEVEDAVKSLTKFASIDFPIAKPDEEKEESIDELIEVVEKAGSKFSKATEAQLMKIKEAIDKLLAEKAEDVKKKVGDEELSPEVTAQLAKLKEFEDKEAEDLKKVAKEKEEAEKAEMADMKKTQDDLKKEIDDLKLKTKKRGVKKGLDEKEEEETDEDLWPSLTLPHVIDKE